MVPKTCGGVTLACQWWSTCLCCSYRGYQPKRCPMLIPGRRSPNYHLRSLSHIGLPIPFVIASYTTMSIDVYSMCQTRIAVYNRPFTIPQPPLLWSPSPSLRPGLISSSSLFGLLVFRNENSVALLI